MRAFLFWCHLVVGVFAGTVVLIMSVTDVLLTFECQLLAWADTRGFDVTPPPGSTRLPIEEVVPRVRTASPELSPVSVTVRADRRKPAAVSACPRTLQVHPYGQVLGRRGGTVARGLATVTDWHGWLAMSGESRRLAAR